MTTLAGLAVLACVLTYYAGRSHWKTKAQHRDWKLGYWEGYRQGYYDCQDDKPAMRDTESVSLQLTKINPE